MRAEYHIFLCHRVESDLLAGEKIASHDHDHDHGHNHEHEHKCEEDHVHTAECGKFPLYIAVFKFGAVDFLIMFVVIYDIRNVDGHFRLPVSIFDIMFTFPAVLIHFQRPPYYLVGNHSNVSPLCFTCSTCLDYATFTQVTIMDTRRMAMLIPMTIPMIQVFRQWPLYVMVPWILIR